MYAIAINGSPRKGGNTEIMLKAAIAPLENAGWQTEYVRIGGKPIRGCLACGKCAGNPELKCVQTEDGFNEIMEKMLRADAILLGSPTYFTDVTSEMKGLIDRSGFIAVCNNRAFSGKIGVAVAAARKAGAVHVFDTINHMFLMNQMIVPGSIYWNLGLGEDKGEVNDDKEALTNMENLGQIIDWLGCAIAPNKANFEVDPMSRLILTFFKLHFLD